MCLLLSNLGVLGQPQCSTPEAIFCVDFGALLKGTSGSTWLALRINDLDLTRYTSDSTWDTNLVIWDLLVTYTLIPLLIVAWSVSSSLSPCRHTTMVNQSRSVSTSTTAPADHWKTSLLQVRMLLLLLFGGVVFWSDLLYMFILPASFYSGAGDQRGTLFQWQVCKGSCPWRDLVSINQSVSCSDNLIGFNKIHSPLNNFLPLCRFSLYATFIAGD